MWQLSLSSCGLALLLKKTRSQPKQHCSPLKGSWNGKELVFWAAHTHTHTHTHCFILRLSWLFFFSVQHHTFLQPNTLYIAKTDTLKWSWTWQALKEFWVCTWLPVIICFSISVFPPNYHEKHKVRKEIVLLSLRNYNFKQEARREVMNFTVQELSHDEIPSWMFKIILSRTGCCLVAKLCLTLCDTEDCSPPGSSVPGILQARILHWVAISLSRGFPEPGI